MPFLITIKESLYLLIGHKIVSVIGREIAHKSNVEIKLRKLTRGPRRPMAVKYVLYFNELLKNILPVKAKSN